MKSSKKDRATTVQSNSPIINLPDQPSKDKSNRCQNFSITRRHFGIANIINAFLSINGIGGKGI
jgi:hypothetical protein